MGARPSLFAFWLPVLAILDRAPRCLAEADPSILHRSLAESASGAETGTTEELYPQDIALCVIDASQALFALGFAGNALRGATVDCQLPLETNSNITDCAVDVVGVMYQISYVASYLSAAASDCFIDIDLQAFCSADIMGVVAATGELTGSVAAMTQSCKVNGTAIIDNNRRLASAAPVPGARQPTRVRGTLPKTQQDIQRGRGAPNAKSAIGARRSFGGDQSSGGGSTAAEKLRQQAAFVDWPELQTAMAARADRQQSISDCFFNAGQASASLVRAGLSLEAAIQDCDAKELHEEPFFAKISCAVDITGLLGSFSDAASAISAAVSGCPVQGEDQAACSSNVITILGDVANLMDNGASLIITCGGLHPVAGANPSSPETPAPTSPDEPDRDNGQWIPMRRRWREALEDGEPRSTDARFAGAAAARRLARAAAEEMLAVALGHGRDTLQNAGEQGLLGTIGAGPLLL